MGQCGSYHRHMKSIAYITLCLIWGTTWLTIRVSLHGLGPLTGAGLRFVIAGTALYLAAWIAGRMRRPYTVQWRLVAVLAIFSFAFDYGLVYTAETRLDSGMVSVLFSVLPFFTFLFARSMLGERAPKHALVGAAVALAGICVVSLTRPVHSSPAFALLVIVAASCSSFANVYLKRQGEADPLILLPPAMLLGGALMLAAGVALEPVQWQAATSFSSVAALLYLSICGSAVAFFLLLWLIDRLPAIPIGLFAFIVPIIALVVGAIFGGEHIDARSFIGSMLVIIGVAATLSPSERSLFEWSSAISMLRRFVASTNTRIRSNYGRM
jgi:drug/metabolite transporter (DMT)-like permease